MQYLGWLAQYIFPVMATCIAETTFAYMRVYPLRHIRVFATLEAVQNGTLAEYLKAASHAPCKSPHTPMSSIYFDKECKPKETND